MITFTFGAPASAPPSLTSHPYRNPHSHTRSPAQWKPSDTLHYVTLVPIKVDTISCQRAVIASGKVSCSYDSSCPQHFSVLGCLLRRYKAIHTDGKRSIGCRCEGGVCTRRLSQVFCSTVVGAVERRTKKTWRNRQTNSWLEVEKCTIDVADLVSCRLTFLQPNTL